MLEHDTLTAALSSALPLTYRPQAPALADALLGALVDPSTSDGLSPYAPLFAALTGRQIDTGGAVISFGENDLRGATITISGDVASGSIIRDNNVTFTITIPHPTVPTALHQLPSPVADFVGRIEEIAQLVDLITQTSANGTVATINSIRGLGGLGKTQLAYKVAQQVTHFFPDAQIVVELGGTSGTPLSPSLALQHIIRAFEPLAPLSHNLTQLQSTYRSLLNTKRVFILADDAYDAEQVRALVPPAGSALLVTSRQRFSLPGMHVLDLWTVSPHEAKNLLLSICPRIGSDVDQLAELCGNLPLALRVSASVLTDASLNVKEFVWELADEQQRLRHLRDPEDTSLNVEASLNLSYRKLTAVDQEVLCQCSVFRGSFNRDATNAIIVLSEKENTKDAAATQPLFSVDESVQRLHRRSLIEWDIKTERFHLHDLVRAFGASRLAEGDRVNLRHAQYYLQVARLTDSLYTQGVTSIHEGLDLFDRERANIASGWSWALKQDESSLPEVAELIRGYSSTLIITGSLRYTVQQSQIIQIEAELTAARRSRDRVAEGRLLNNLGTAYQTMGEVDQAISCYGQALAISRQQNRLIDEAAALRNLGRAYVDLDEDDKAVSCYEQALVIAKDINDKRSEGFILLRLGFVHIRQKDLNGALQLCKKSFQIMQDIKDRFGQASALNGLGTVYSHLNENTKALENYEQALLIWKEMEDYQNEVVALINLGLLYENLRDINKSIYFFECSLAIVRKIGDWKEESNILCSLGRVYFRQRNAHLSINSYKIALKIAQEMGNKRLESNIFVGIGDTFREAKSFPQSIDYYNKSLDIRKSIKDVRGQIYVLQRIINLYYYDLKKYKDCVMYIQNILNDTTFFDNRSLVFFIQKLASSYTNLMNYDEAILYHEQARKMMHEIGDRTGERLELYNIAYAQKALNQKDLAISYFRQTLAIDVELGNRHDEADILDDLGWVYNDKGATYPAIDCFNKALSLFKEFKDFHGEISSLLGLGSCYKKQSKYEEAIECIKKALNISKEIKDRRQEGMCLRSIAAIYSSRDDYYIAAKYYKESIHIWKEIGDKNLEANNSWYLALMLEKVGDLVTAENYMKICVEYEREVGDPKAEAHADCLEKLQRTLQEIEKKKSRGWLGKLFRKS